MIGIVVSRADSASVHIGEHLLMLADWAECPDKTRPDSDGGGTVYRTEGFELREFDALHLELEEVAEAFDDPAFVVFVSRHAGDTGPLLTAHFTGNFGSAKHGGRDRDLATACPNAHSSVVEALIAYAPDDYNVSTECTHHGPTNVGAPSMFVELGSSETAWNDSDGARAVAHAVLDLDGVKSNTERTLVAFGGGHYAPRPSRIIRETEWSVGHIASDWSLEDLSDLAAHRTVLEQVFTESGATRAVVDGDKPELETAIETLGYDVVSETWVREVSDVPLPVATILETELSTVAAGLRFGEPARTYNRDVSTDSITSKRWFVVRLPEKLIELTHAITHEGTVASALETALAVETVENGNRLGSHAVFPRADAYEAFVGRLVSILEREYTVTWNDDTIIAEQTVFNPTAAIERGVPEGPAFGQLANGESVTVNGNTIHPTDVSRIESTSISVEFRDRMREIVCQTSDIEGKDN